MTYVFIQQNIDKDAQFFTGYYGSFDELVNRHKNIITSCFPAIGKLKSLIEKQGFYSVLLEEFNLDYRIEIK